MTLRQYARAAGTSASRLSDYEHAKVAPTTDVLARLAHVQAFYGVPMTGRPEGAIAYHTPPLESSPCPLALPGPESPA